MEKKLTNRGKNCPLPFFYLLFRLKLKDNHRNYHQWLKTNLLRVIKKLYRNKTLFSVRNSVSGAKYKLITICVFGTSIYNTIGPHSSAAVLLLPSFLFPLSKHTEHVELQHNLWKHYTNLQHTLSSPPASTWSWFIIIIIIVCTLTFTVLWSNHYSLICVVNCRYYHDFLYMI